MSRRCSWFASRVAVTGLVVLAAACSNTTGLPAAGITNVVDTTSLFALFGTPIATPSAYDLNGRLTGHPLVRTDQASAFDFAFNFDSLRRPVLLPTGAVGLGQSSGLQQASVPFDSIKVAPTGGYVLDRGLVVDSGAVVIVRSRPTGCLFGVTVFTYAKLVVVAIDTTVRRIDFRILVDQNCGYRGLEPGIPTQ
jgi:hypothetical protein